jgi:hypothetical protein
MSRAASSRGYSAEGRGLNVAIIGSDEFVAANSPTLANIVKHVKRYGLDNKHTGYRGREKTYKNYKQFAKDSAAKAVRDNCDEKAYAQFTDFYGPPGTVEAAIEDYRAQRET